MQEICSYRMGGQKKSWRSFWNRLKGEPDLMAISSNPLILTLLIARFLRDSLSPHYAGEAVSAIVEALSDEWDSIRGVRRTVKPSFTPKQKLALLRHLAGKLTAEGKTTFSSDEYARIMEGMTASQDYSAALIRLEEETSLVHRSGADNWIFLHACIQDYLSALFVGAKAGVETTNWTDNKVNKWERLWRYICWIASDASQLLKQKAAGPYNVEDVLLATKALSQNLLVERDVVTGYGLSVEWLLDKYLKNTTVDAFKWTVTGDVKAIHLTCKTDSGPDALERFIKLRSVFEALHQARDGVAKSEVRHRIHVSQSNAVRSVAPIVMGDGLLHCKLHESAEIRRLDVYLEPEDVEPETIPTFDGGEE